MNWDISIGRFRQSYGRVLQRLGHRLDRRPMVLNGERIEFSGRLQMRYGMVKHQVQWGPKLARIPQNAAGRAEGLVRPSTKSL